jgi:hypothetical protein
MPRLAFFLLLLLAAVAVAGGDSPAADGSGDSEDGSLCVLRNGAHLFDLRFLQGTHEIPGPDRDSYYMFSPCGPMPVGACNDAPDVAVCRFARATRVDKVSLFLQTNLGTFPEVSVWGDTDAGEPLHVMFTPAQDTMLMQQLEQVSSFAMLRMNEMSPALAAALQGDVAQLLAQTKVLQFASVVRYNCPANASDMDPEAPATFRALGLVNSTDLTLPPGLGQGVGQFYALDVTHPCACANASCPYPKPHHARHCVQVWELFLWRNYPALVTVLIFALFERRTRWLPNFLWGRPGLPTPVNFLQVCPLIISP